MSKKLTEKHTAHVPRWVYLSLLLVTALMMVAKLVAVQPRYTKHPVVYTLEKKTPMEFYFVTDKGIDTVFLSLAQGTQVRVLGYHNASYYHTHKLLAETSDGQRGFIRVVDLGVPFVVEKTGDTLGNVRVQLAKGPSLGKYSVHVDKNNTETYTFKQLRPVLPDSLKSPLLASNHGEYYMSRKKFERLYMGKGFGYGDSLYREATMVYRDKNGVRANFLALCVFDKKKGHSYSPTVTYDAQGVATGYQLGYQQGNSAWWLKILPFVNPIIDIDFFAQFIQSSVYENIFTAMSRPNLEGKYQWFDYVIFGLLVLLQFFALFLPPSLLLLLLGFLMYYPKVFYPLGDAWLKGFAIVGGLLAFYPWLVLSVTWGMMFFIQLLGVGLVWLIYVSVIVPLDTEPHQRCLGCRSLYTNLYARREILSERDVWENRSEMVKETGREYNRYTTYDEVHWSDGRTTKENVKHHSELAAVHGLVYDYRVKVHITEYNSVYVCSHCGHEERVRGTERKDVEKQKVGERKV